MDRVMRKCERRGNPITHDLPMLPMPFPITSK